MPRPNTPARPQDFARLIARVEELERRIRIPAFVQPEAAGSLERSDFLRALDDGTGTGLATGTFHTLVFAVVTATTSGEDITIEGGVPTINTDGVYALMLWLRATADAAADTFNWVQFQLSIDRFGVPRHGPTLVAGFYPALDAGNKHYGEIPITPTLYCPAGTTLEAKAKMSGGGAGTWSVSAGDLHIDRIG